MAVAAKDNSEVWVVNHLSDSVSGGPLAILNLFVDSLRSLTALPNGSRVYAGAFMSGNGTTTIDALAVAGAKPEPRSNKDGIPAPKTGLIVKQAGNRWLDETGTNWASEVKFDLPDYDVFETDTTTPVPKLRRQISVVGTTVFNLVVNAERGELYVSNLEARNEVRFEGPGESAPTVRGHIADTRISVVSNVGAASWPLSTWMN